jgi:hypothetical protein
LKDLNLVLLHRLRGAKFTPAGDDLPALSMSASPCGAQYKASQPKEFRTSA